MRKNSKITKMPKKVVFGGVDFLNFGLQNKSKKEVTSKSDGWVVRDPGPPRSMTKVMLVI